MHRGFIGARIDIQCVQLQGAVERHAQGAEWAYVAAVRVPALPRPVGARILRQGGGNDTEQAINGFQCHGAHHTIRTVFNKRLAVEATCDLLERNDERIVWLAKFTN